MSFNRVQVLAGESRPEILVPRARAALAGGTSPLSVESAIEALASSTFPNRHRDIEQVLMDRQAPRRVRMRAAMALARCDRDSASEILVSALAVDDSVVRLGVV